MDDIARLQIRIESLEAAVAEDRLDKLERQGGKTERATDKLTESFKRFAGPVAIAAGAVAALTKTVSVTREFNVLNAQLITATGSAENAAIAFEAIQDFAADTPFDLAQVTDGFTKLVNLGLTPSEAALTSYGNTASAIGKDLNQLIEAVADAATGEFERLKEFGIEAKSEGDNVSFTFRGVSTTIGKNAAEIEAYLQALGENEFAGAMQQRVETLDGAISNLGDEWNKLFLNISNQGIGSLVEDSVRLAIDIIAELNAMLASGEIQAYLDAIGGKFQGLADDVIGAIDIIVEYWNQFLGTSEGSGLAGATNETIEFIIAAFKNLPENIRAVIQLMAVEIGALVDYGKAYGAAFGEVLGAEFAKIVEKSKAYGQAIGQAINPFDDGNFDLEARLRELDNIAAEVSDNAFQRAERESAITTQARRDSIVAILEERDTALSSFNTQIQAAQKLRSVYDDELAARRAATGDRLEAFKVGGSTEGGGQNEADAKAQKAREKEFEKLRLSLRTEEEVIQESYNRRLAIILENTEETSQQRADLKERLDQEFATQALGEFAEPDTVEEEIARLEAKYAARIEIIRERLGEESDLEIELTKQKEERKQQLEAQAQAVRLQNASEFFGGVYQIASAAYGKESKAAKAAAIAQAVINTYQSATAAYSSLASIPYVGPALGAAAAASAIAVGLENVNQIRSQNVSGAYDAGGTIPQGKIGLVGEFGPELVEGPANVRSRRETAEMFKEGGAANDAPSTTMQNNVRIINNIDPSVLEDYLGSSAGEEVIMNTIRNNPETLRAVSGS